MSEFKEHQAVAQHIRANYPGVVFTSDSSGIRMNIGPAMKMLSLKSKYKIPDILILKPMKGFHGLIIELKATGSSPFKKNGDLKSDHHLSEQNRTLKQLRIEGYFATFATGFEECRDIIDQYLKP